mgnify:FL=1
MAGGGQMGGGQPPSGAYGSPNFDSSNPVNQPPSGSGMNPFRQAGGAGGLGMASLGAMAGSGMGAAGAMPQNMGGAMQPGESNAVDSLYRNIYNRPASADELSFYKNEFGDDVSSEEAQSLRQRLEESRGTESITPQQPSMDTQPIPFNDPYFQPRFDYMYGNQFNSMNQFNPFTRGYYGADPMYGGYSPFYPALPTPNMQSMPSRLGEIEEQLEEQKRKLDEEEASRKTENLKQARWPYNP